jgi:hypothetical protein
LWLSSGWALSRASSLRRHNREYRGEHAEGERYQRHDLASPGVQSWHTFAGHGDDHDAVTRTVGTLTAEHATVLVRRE